MSISSDEAKNNERLHELINFMMASGRNISNWEYIQSLNFIPDHPMILYRGLCCEMHEVTLTTTRCTSWSRSRAVAESCGTTVLTCKFSPSHFVFDTRHLAPDLLMPHRWQQEIIIKPIDQHLDTHMEKHDFPEMSDDIFT